MGKRVRKAAAEKELAESRRALAMDVASVNRFINAAMGSDLTGLQKQALRDVGGTQQQRGVTAGKGTKRNKGEEGGAAAQCAAAAAEAFLAELPAPAPSAAGEAAHKKKKKKGRAKSDKCQHA